ncbi:Integrin beta-6 [Geodia barretti]|nr:Integrin beta-6 [Geodia barretti]
MVECANVILSCGPTYVYRHHLPLTSDSGQLREVLENVTIRGNLDAPEAPLEALLQSVVCLDEVGWRNGSLRIVMILTDAGFKTALDGRVAGLVTRNDGECHLKMNKEGFYEYFRSPEQDYPSIHQVRDKLIENDIITIFAVAEDVVVNRTSTDNIVYRELAKEIGNSRAFVQTIAEDSADIVSVIRIAYESVKRDIVVDGVSGLTIGIAPVLNCNLLSDGSGCANVAPEQLEMFNVTVTMDQCLPDTQTQLLPLPGFGNVELTLVPICECNCSSQMSPNHPSCGDRGSLVCGACDCYEGFYGEQCECDDELGPCLGDCFNRGTCDNCTRECISCDTYQDTIGGVFQIVGSFGERCQCDNSTGAGACPVGRDIDQVCSGWGECMCDGEKCDCDCECGAAPLSGQQYSGDDCGCDPDNCYNEQYPGRECAHSRNRHLDGHCDCNKCECPAEDSVYFNRTCINRIDLCDMFDSCARCWPRGCTTEDCQSGYLEDSMPEDSGALFCQFEQDSCIIVNYLIVPSGPSYSMARVYFLEYSDCQSSEIDSMAWVAPVMAVQGFLLLVAVPVISGLCILRKHNKNHTSKAVRAKYPGMKGKGRTLWKEEVRKKRDDEKEDFETTAALTEPLMMSDVLEELVQEMSSDGLFVPDTSIIIQNVVGEGEFGVVYKALLHGWKEYMYCLVAVKTLKGMFSCCDVKHLAEESKIMATFDHPNVMKLIGVSINKYRNLFIVMPFMAKGSLLYHLTRNRHIFTIESEEITEMPEVTSSRLLSMCLQIAKGMEYLAHNKFVHRDLAARNCMIDLNNVIKVADFGLTEDIYARNYFRQTTEQERMESLL